MEILNVIFEKYTESTIMMATLAVTVCIIFKLLSKKLAYVIIRILNVKTEDKKEITENGFYKPLSTLISIAGLYTGILFLKKPLKINIETIIFINKIFKIIVTFLIAKGLADSLTTKSKFFKKIAYKAEYKTDESSIKLIINIVRGAIYIVAGFIAILEIGYDLSGLVTGLGIGSIVITLAAQDTAKSLLGGLMITIDKPFKVGDWISTASAEGTVEEITFRSTRIRNIQNSVVNVPNSIMAESVVTNGSKIKMRRFEAKIALEKNTSLEKLRIFEDTVIQMLKLDENVKQDTIRVYFDKIGDNGFEIAIYAFINTADYTIFLNIKEELNYKIMNIVNEQNIILSYSTQTLYVKH